MTETTECIVGLLSSNVGVIAGGVGFIFLALGFVLATRRPMSSRERKSFEKDEYLRGKK